MAVYQKAANVVRRRQLRVPGLRRPGARDSRRAGPGGRAGRRRLAPSGSPACCRVESLDAMPLVWSLDDVLIALDRLPALARKPRLEHGEADDQERRSQDERDDGQRRGPRGRRRSAREAEGPAERATRSSAGTLIDETGNDDGRRGPAAEDARAQRHRDGEGPARRGRRLRGSATGSGGRRSSGPPVLLADGFAAIEVDGRRLAVVGMILIALVTLSAVHSVWWAIVPDGRGLDDLAGDRDAAARLPHQALALGRPARGPDHRPDDAGGQPPGDPLPRRPPPRGGPAAAAGPTLRTVAVPILWTAITGAIGYGALVTSDLVPIQQFGAILGTCTLCSAILVMVLSPIAMLPPFPLEIPVREGSRSRVAAAMNRLTYWVFRHPGR